MNELTISQNNQAFEAHLFESLKTLQECDETVTALSTLSFENNSTLIALLTEQKNLQRYQLGYALGLLKAYIDTLPHGIAKMQKVGGIQLDLLLKLKLDSEVLNRRESLDASDFTIETEYWPRYRRLSSHICGYGYNMYFIQDRFEAFYPAGIHQTVSGFARGYSAGFHTIAAEAGIETITTQPVEQDIWKNWPFFLKHEVHEYRLDGEYLFMYHGGFNRTSNPSIPRGNNVKIVNSGVYEQLQGRPESEFVIREFPLTFLTR